LEKRGTAPSHSGIEKGPLPTPHSARASIRLLSALDPHPLLAVFEQFEHYSVDVTFNLLLLCEGATLFCIVVITVNFLLRFCIFENLKKREFFFVFLLPCFTRFLEL